MDLSTLTIVHSLPGRIRLRAEPALSDFEQVREQVRLHPGVYLLSYNRTTQSILAQFDPDQIANSELVVRLAVAISVARGLQPVAIGTKPRRESVDRYGLLSGTTIAAAAVSTMIAATSSATRILTTAAGIGTAAAILSHAWREYRERGDFHPETLSVIYLGSAFIRGAVLPASAVAWIATFARHFTGTNPERYVVEVGRGDAAGEYEAKVRRWQAPENSDSLLRFAASLVADAVTGEPHSPDSLLSQMKEVSRTHDATLEGLEGVERNLKLSIE